MLRLSVLVLACVSSLVKTTVSLETPGKFVLLVIKKSQK